MKKILGILGLILGAVAVYFGIMFAPEIKGAFLGNNTEPPTQDVEEHEKELTGDVVAGVQDSDMLRLTKKNKVSANGQALDVTATLSPAYISDKTVSWSIAWASTNSATVTDYVTITPSTDTLTCAVSVKKAFTTQIILTCTANSNSNVKATCTIDYVDRKFESSQGESDICGENPYEYTILELLNEADDKSYNTHGGTLDGTLKDHAYTSFTITINGNEETFTDFNKSVGEYMEELATEYGIDSVVTGFNSGLDVYGQADIYYSTTLIASDVSTLFGFRLIVDDSYFVADGLTLNDTQLIF